MSVVITARSPITQAQWDALAKDIDDTLYLGNGFPVPEEYALKTDPRWLLENEDVIRKAASDAADPTQDVNVIVEFIKTNIAKFVDELDTAIEGKVKAVPLSCYTASHRSVVEGHLTDLLRLEQRWNNAGFQLEIDNQDQSKISLYVVKENVPRANSLRHLLRTALILASLEHQVLQLTPNFGLDHQKFGDIDLITIQGAADDMLGSNWTDDDRHLSLGVNKNELHTHLHGRAVLGKWMLQNATLRAEGIM